MWPPSRPTTLPEPVVLTGVLLALVSAFVGVIEWAECASVYEASQHDYVGRGAQERLGQAAFWWAQDAVLHVLPLSVGIVWSHTPSHRGLLLGASSVVWWLIRIKLFLDGLQLFRVSDIPHLAGALVWRTVFDPLLLAWLALVGFLLVPSLGHRIS